MQTWHLKYRPKKFKDFIGQTSAIQQVEGMLERGIPSRSLLITGPSGNGKTSLARAIAEHINGSNEDIYEESMIEKASIDDIRGMVRLVRLKPKAQRRIFILDEAHGLTVKSAGSSLFKLIEEPPAHVLFILATNEPEKLLKTVVNRCSKIIIDRIEPEDISYFLLKIAKREKLKITDKHKSLAITYISENCNGVMREAVNQFEDFWDRYIGSGGKFTKEQFRSLLHSKDSTLDEIAVKIVASLHSSNRNAAIKLFLENKLRFNELMSKCLMLNRFIIEDLTDTENRRYIPIFKQLTSTIKQEPKLHITMKYHKVLTDLKNAVTFGIATDDDKLIAGLSALYGERV